VNKIVKIRKKTIIYLPAEQNFVSDRRSSYQNRVIAANISSSINGNMCEPPFWAVK